jgi:hypothetical protein
MKFIYNNTNYEIDIEDFISVYHLRTLIKRKYGFIIDDSYSITDLEGKIYKADGIVIRNNETVVIKKKLRGGQDYNPYDKDVADGLRNPIAFITAIVSGFYYFKYINGILLNSANDIEYLIYQKDKNIETYGETQKGGFSFFKKRESPKQSQELQEMSENKNRVGELQHTPIAETPEMKKMFEMNELNSEGLLKNKQKIDTISMNNINSEIISKLKNILKTNNPDITNTQIKEILKKNPSINEEQNIEKKASKIANAMKQPSIFKVLLESFKQEIQDSRFEKVNCSFDRLFPEKELNRDYDNISNWNMILTSAIFFTYFLTILIALFINPVSTKYCGTPNGAIGILTFVMIFIPLILVFVMPYIVKVLDFLFVKIFHLASGPVFSNYKLATANIILIVMLIVFCFLNIKGISPMFGAMIPVFMLIFSVCDFILKKFGILRFLARKLGNIITNTEKIPDDLEHMFDTSLKGIKPSHRIKQNENYPAPECYYRFNIFHSLLYGVIVCLFSHLFFTIVYDANIKYCCPK